jgi:hypothetical protein
LQESLNSLFGTPYGIAVFVATLWCFGGFSISIVSGWFSLSRRFRAQGPPYGDTKTVGPHFYTVYMRFWGHYRGIIRMTAAEDALYLSVLFLFRIGHPPLRIPWNEIQIGRAKILWRQYIVLTLGDEDRIPMRISERMAGKLGILERLPS